jgi:hypothetical protein
MAEHVLSGRNMSGPQNAWQAEERVPASGHKTRGRFRRDTLQCAAGDNGAALGTASAGVTHGHYGRGARYTSDAAFGDTHGASAHLPDDHSRLTFPVADLVERWHRAAVLLPIGVKSRRFGPLYKTGVRGSWVR